MRKQYLFLLIINISIFNISYNNSLFAYGVGFYTTGKVGDAFLNLSNDVNYGNHLNYGIGFGFVYDSAVASNDRFNYRLNAGYENHISTNAPLFSDKSMHRVTLSNTFGFALYTSRSVRLWMGPQVELACQFAERTWTSNADSVAGLGYEQTTMHYKYTLGQIGIGGILGINVHTGDLFTLGFEAGLNLILETGRYEYSENGFGISTFPPSSPQFSPSMPKRVSNTILNMKADALVRINFIFRVGDAEKIKV